MPLIIDTYNVLHVSGVLPPDLAGIDTAGLIQLLQTSRYRDERIILVCDGTPPAHAPAGRIGPEGRIEVQYSGPDLIADDAISRLIDNSSEPRRLIVVSSDRRHVLAAARRRRCRVMTSEQFLAQLAGDHHLHRRTPSGPPPPTTPLSRGEVATWMEEFGIDERELKFPPSITDERSVPPPAEASPPAPESSDTPERVEPETHPTDQQPAPDPLIPRSVLEEAHDLAASIDDERDSRDHESSSDQLSSVARREVDEAAPETDAAPAADEPPVHPWRSFLAPELIAEAPVPESRRPSPAAAGGSPRQSRVKGERCESDPDRGTDGKLPRDEASRERGSEEQPPLTSGRRGSGEDTVPPDVLEEAEAIWREEDRDEDPGGEERRG